MTSIGRLLHPNPNFLEWFGMMVIEFLDEVDEPNRLTPPSPLRPYP